MSMLFLDVTAVRVCRRRAQGLPDMEPRGRAAEPPGPGLGVLRMGTIGLVLVK